MRSAGREGARTSTVKLTDGGASGASSIACALVWRDTNTRASANKIRDILFLRDARRAKAAPDVSRTRTAREHAQLRADCDYRPQSRIEKRVGNFPHTRVFLRSQRAAPNGLAGNK